MMNKVFLLGRLTKDVEAKQAGKGKVANFTMVTNEKYEADGVKKEKSEFHSCVAWNGLATLLENFGKKGKQLQIEGKLETTSYDKNGEKIYQTKIKAEKINLLGDAPNYKKGEANGNSLDKAIDLINDTFASSKTDFSQDEVPF